MGEWSIIDDVGLVDGHGVYSATFIADGTVEAYSIRLADFQRHIGHISPGHGSGDAGIQNTPEATEQSGGAPSMGSSAAKELSAIAGSRRELRFAKIAAAKARYFASAPPPESPALLPTTQQQHLSSSPSSPSSSQALQRRSRLRPAGKFRSVAYDVAWKLLEGERGGRSQAKGGRAEATKQAAEEVKASLKAQGSASGTGVRSLSNDTLRFVKIRGTGADSKEHLPTGSAFSLLQLIQEPI